MYKDEQDQDHLYTEGVDTSFSSQASFYTKTLGNMDTYLPALGYRVVEVRQPASWLVYNCYVPTMKWLWTFSPVCLSVISTVCLKVQQRRHPCPVDTFSSVFQLDWDSSFWLI